LKDKNMIIKTNLRAGSGGASGVGGNSIGSHSGLTGPVVFLNNLGIAPSPLAVPWSRCAGL
jgi:hypothetical protein